jgi:hypothetical protein
VHESITNPAFHYYFSALPQPALIDTRLKDRDRRLLAAFYLIAGRGNIVYNKTREDLGKLARMAQNVVSTTSARLVEFGWLRKSGSGGRGHSARYELTIPEFFTHLKRPPSLKSCKNTTQQHTVPVTSAKNFKGKKTDAPHEKSSITSAVPLPLIQESGYSLSSSLAYPNGLSPAFANSLLIQLPESQQQVALDEWLGQVTSYKERAIAIHSPNGLFRSIIKAILAGQTTQHAAHIKQRRERATLLAKAIEPPAQKTPDVTESSPSSAKRFAPGELKAKIMADVLKLKQEAPPSKPVTSIEKSRHTARQLKEEKPSHFMTSFLYINTKPTKNIKPTTTVSNETSQTKIDGVPHNSGSGDLKINSDNTILPSILCTKDKLEGVGTLADDQTQPCTLLAELTSAHEFVDEPLAQGVGRGQSLVGDSPPHPLSTTSFTRPDALRLPKQINSFSKPSKPDYAQEAPNNTQHGDVSSDTDARTHQKMSAGRDGKQYQKGYRDLSHNQRIGHADQTGNRAMKNTLLSSVLKLIKELLR